MTLTPEEKITLETYNQAGDQWIQTHNTAGFWREEILLLKKFLPEGKILEIGSGGGRDAKELITLGYDYVGTDISDKLLEIAKKENPSAQFLQQSVYDLNFPEHTQFDGFWASMVLLHIPKAKIDSALQRIHVLIKKGGVGFISLKQGTGEKIEEKKFENGEKDIRFFSYYTQKEFAEVLLRNNYEIISTGVRPMSPKSTFLYFFVRVIDSD